MRLSVHRNRTGRSLHIRPLNPVTQTNKEDNAKLRLHYCVQQLLRAASWSGGVPPPWATRHPRLVLVCRRAGRGTPPLYDGDLLSPTTRRIGEADHLGLGRLRLQQDRTDTVDYVARAQ
jgi:hypothetical protein